MRFNLISQTYESALYRASDFRHRHCILVVRISEVHIRNDRLGGDCEVGEAENMNESCSSIWETRVG